MVSCNIIIRLCTFCVAPLRLILVGKLSVMHFKINHMSALSHIHNSAGYKAQLQHPLHHRDWLQFLPPTFPSCAAAAAAHLGLVGLKSLSCLCLSSSGKVAFTCGQWACGFRSGLAHLLSSPLRVTASFLPWVTWGASGAEASRVIYSNFRCSVRVMFCVWVMHDI